MSTKSGQQKLKDFLLANVGEVVNGHQLLAASGLRTYARRIREFRTELGWAIQSIRDNPSLKQDEYILVEYPTGKKPPRFSRRVPNNLRAAVLRRNHSICRLCGITADDNYEDGRKVTLHVDHVIPKQAGGTDDMENLRTLCSRCNEGDKDNMPPPPSNLLVLKGQVRNANIDTQREIYDWLKRKFKHE